MKRSLTFLTVILQLSFATLAQQPSPTATVTAGATRSQQIPQLPTKPVDEEVVRITTNLVQVDAVVTDSKGKPVTDLQPDELEIREDGRPQKITNFSYFSLDPREEVLPSRNDKPVDKNVPPVPPVRLQPEQVRRTIALVVDDLGLSFDSTYSVRQALKKFVDQQMQPDDLVAIIRTGGGIGALQQFTSDKRQLYAAIEKVKWNFIGRGRIGTFAPISPLEGGRWSDRDSEGKVSEDIDQFREDIFAIGTLGALNYIVRGLRELPGRKSVVLLSDGIRIFNASDPSRSTRLLNALRRLTDLANRASVVIYTMDARGLQYVGLTAADSTADLSADQIEQRLSDRRSELFDSQSGLSYLAEQTGGLSIRNTNDLAGGIRRVLDDQKGYYLIGYRPDDSTFDSISGRRKFHRLSLRINRPGKFKVRIRNGFYGFTDEEVVSARRTPQEQLLSAMTSPFAASGVHLRLTSLFANDAKIGSFMRSLLYVRGRDLEFTAEPDGWHKATFRILTVTFGDNGAVVDQINRTHTIRAKDEAYDRILNDGFVYSLTVPLQKPGSYQLRAALRDEVSERIGSATQFVEVPDIKKNRLTVSGILVRALSSEKYQKIRRARSSEGQDSEDQDEDQDLSNGAAVRQFAHGNIMEYAYFIYNAQIDKASMKPALLSQVRLFRNGQPIFTGKELPIDTNKEADLKRLPVVGGLQLGTQLTPGEYVFQIIVTDTLAKEKHRIATQWIDFEVK